MIRLCRELHLAIGFLTRIPVGMPSSVTPGEFGRSLAFFPLVGLLLGALLAAGDAGLSLLLPQPVVAALLLTLLALLTGALHLDGFADLCDGLGGGRDRESALRIMKDSSIGAFGAVGLVLLLLVKYQALVSLPASVRLPALIVMPAAGRWAPVLLAGTLPYLRGPEGIGAAFAGHSRGRNLLLASLTLLLAAAGMLRLEGLLVCVGVLLAAGFFMLWIKRRLGGMTGDVLGASVELTEVVTLLLIVAFMKP